MPVNESLILHTNVICANVFIRKDARYLVIKRSPKKTFAPNVIHPVGGKLNPNENPYLGALREVSEETGLAIGNLKLEAVICEIHHDLEHNWLIFHFSADYVSGNVRQTNEGILLWLTGAEILKQELYPSMKSIVTHILNPNDGTVFATFEYNSEGHMITESTIITLCAR